MGEMKFQLVSEEQVEVEGIRGQWGGRNWKGELEQLVEEP